MDPIQMTGMSDKIDFSPGLKNDLDFLGKLKLGEKISVDEKNDHKLSISGSQVSGYLSYVPLVGGTLLNYVAVPLSRRNNGDTVGKTVEFLSALSDRIENETKNLSLIDCINENNIYNLVDNESKLYETTLKTLNHGLHNLCETYKDRISSDEKKDQESNENNLTEICSNIESSVKEFYDRKILILHSKVDKSSIRKISVVGDIKNKLFFMQRIPSLCIKTEDLEQTISHLKFENEMLSDRNRILSDTLQRKETDVIEYFSNVYVNEEVEKVDKFSQWLFIPHGEIAQATVVETKKEFLNFYEKEMEEVTENKEINNDLSSQYGRLYQKNMSLREDNQKLREQTHSFILERSSLIVSKITETKEKKFEKINVISKNEEIENYFDIQHVTLRQLNANSCVRNLKLREESNSPVYDPLQFTKMFDEAMKGFPLSPQNK